LGWRQLQVEEQANELTAIPARLRLLDGTGAVVTIDAMGCQKERAQTMTDQGADYVLALQDKHPTLAGAVALLLHNARATGFAAIAPASHAPVDGDHGRIETRRSEITSEIEWLGAQASWATLPSVGMVEARREGRHTIQGEARYFLTARPAQGGRCKPRHDLRALPHFGDVSLALVYRGNVLR
jgi:predicted transposase YbfD/YdcC